MKEAEAFQQFLELEGDNPADLAIKLGIGVVAIFLFFKLIGTVLGFAVILGVAAVIGHVANNIVPRKIPYGFVGSTLAGLVGAFLGTKILGAWGPAVAGLHIVPGVVGAVAIAGVIHVKMTMDRAKSLEAYQAAADNNDPYVMRLLGEYRLIEMLGKGACARVYKAVPNRSLDESEAVAIKILEPESTNNEEFMGRYYREIDLCTKLDNPSIIKILDHGDQEGLHFIALELIPGGTTLRSKINEGGGPIIEVAGYLTQLMLALDHAHSMEVVHRDIKPDNILMKGNRCKISDFGLSRGSDDPSLTKTGTALGTPSYMAPEQIEGMKNISPACDQYALGVVAYELLTGEKPFTAREPMQVLFKHLHEEAPSPQELRPEVPDKIAEIVLRMLEKSEQDRFPNLGEAAEELKKFMLTYKPPKMTVKKEKEKAVATA